MRIDKFLILLIFCALIIRLVPFDFPSFTFEEARLAHRGYTLASSGKDELGRSFPVLFNSSQDYQLPATSYITALGTLIFGKNDFGARIPFIMISFFLIVLIYKVADIFSHQRLFRLFCVLLTAFSPPLIFLSKVPNETILLTFGLVLLFYLLTREKLNFVRLGLVMVLTLVSSKLAWWVLVPFTVSTLAFFHPNSLRITKVKITMMSLFLVVASVLLFLQVPQAKRSLLENDFSLFNNSGIKVTIDRLRGQGLEVGWPNFLEKIIFNKLQVILVGFLNWIYSLDPAVLFARFDETGIFNYMSLGSFAKILIIPFVVGIVETLRKRDLKLKALFFYFLILTFPIVFIYPGSSKTAIVTILPFMIFIMALGLLSLNKILRVLIIILMILEVLINILYSSPGVKNANYSRPSWLGAVLRDSYNLLVQNNVAISDDLTFDIAPFLQWSLPIPPTNTFKDVQFAYKIRQNKAGNIRIIGADDNFYFCGLDKPTYIFASKRDLAKIKRWLNITSQKAVEYVYKDFLGQEAVYRLIPTICVK